MILVKKKLKGFPKEELKYKEYICSFPSLGVFGEFVWLSKQALKK